jgi:TM2 domain-containing membrane protein YozV
METKNSGIAIVLSFFWTGLGQLYAGRIGRGLIMMAVAPFVWLIGWAVGFSGIAGLLSGSRAGSGLGLLGVLAGLLPLAYWVWGMTDARNLCFLHNRQSRGLTPVAGYAAVEQDKPQAGG